MKNYFKTIEETQIALQKKQVSVVEVVEAYLSRIKKHNSSLNIYLTVTDEEAYSKAKRLDGLIKRQGVSAFDEKPLLGVPLGYKDLFLTKGVRTTAGSKVLSTYIPAYSSTVVERLEDAGSVMLGKLNCDAWAHGASGENSDFGSTKNPWNAQFVPGGSSSGSAASVAAGLALASTGTDTGGSIRLPANFCGVVGLKPTYGVVSRYGVIAMASSLDSVGFFAQSVEDARLLFDAVKGIDNKDSTLMRIDKSSSNKKARVRIGIPKEYFVKGLEKEVESAVKEAAKVYAKKGVDLVEISLPHTKYAISTYYIIQPAEVSSNLGRYDAVRFGENRQSFGEEAKRRIMLGTYVLSSGYYDAYYLKAMKVRSKIISDFDKVFEKLDAILAPVSPTSAFKLGEKAENPLQMYLADVLTVGANLAGLPALSIPSGFGKNNLPLGFQLIGPRFSENTLFELGTLYHEEVGWKPSVAFE